jgi:CubicO group peptidase (beta-lactamase class C family)
LRAIPLLLLLGIGLAGCNTLRIDRAARVASGFTSQMVCSGTFISGFGPDQAYAELVRPLPGMGLVAWGLHYRVDHDRLEVRTTITGGFESHAAYREGAGCVALHDDRPPQAVQPPPGNEAAPLLSEIAGPALVEPADLRLKAALDHVFTEPGQEPTRRVKAVVVLHDGRVIAERYAPAIGPETPLRGFSATKSVMHALTGVLVRQGLLRIDQPAAVSEWQDAKDPRHAITPDQLLRQVSGLDVPHEQSGFDADSQIAFIARDKAAASAAMPLSAAPGTHWAYTDANYFLLSRLVRDAAGGSGTDVLRFAQGELFGPLGMRHATLELDATGTPMGAASMLASARDWARFGQLYLQDGVAGGRRLLPEGWVRHATTPTLATGYGAGWWLNSVDGTVPEWHIPWGLPHAPRDAFFARGFLGQFVVVVPSQRLVIVRLGHSRMDRDLVESTDRLVQEVMAAVSEPS